ncbi:hypothetical protein QUB73_27040 (plasmid) [Roseibium aggregatum]|nr:hypothetical protein [Roseibium aggregatum]WJS05482.1 hypothetical protein QUB73_27040 [Roseibium aggregatum]
MAPDGFQGIEPACRILKHHSDPVAADPGKSGTIGGNKINTVEFGFSGKFMLSICQQPGKSKTRGGLAASAFPDKGVTLTSAN